MPAPVVATIARTRLLVGALGERVGWWGSEFTSPAARRSFERLFPRTARRAILESVTAIACRDHDDRFHLGPRTNHLFRLPPHQEDRLAAWLTSPDADVGWPPDDVGSIRAELATIASTALGVSRGPMCLGRPARLARLDAIEELVGIYLLSDAHGERAIPYFEEAP